MRIWAIADLHLSKNPSVQKPMDEFGGVWVNHDEKLKENWESMVAPEDTLIIPGDISWALRYEQARDDLAWIDALPGNKLLLKGNHDLWWTSLAKMRGDYESIEYIQNDAHLRGNAVIFGSRGWMCHGSASFLEDEEANAKIYRREVLRLEMSMERALAICEQQEELRGERPVIIGAMHYPPSNGQGEETDFTKLFAQAGASCVVYGHLHGSDAFGERILKSSEGVDYHLVSLDRLDCVPKLIYEERKGE